MVLHTILTFFLNLRRLFFWRTHREICFRIFPHLERDKNYGYPFQTDEELRATLKRDQARAIKLIEILECDSANMPRAYGECFRYIMYRDILRRLERYEEFMRASYQPQTCDSKYVAMRAEI